MSSADTGAFSASALAREIIEDAGPDDLSLLCKELADRTPPEHRAAVIEQVSRSFFRQMLLHPRVSPAPGVSTNANSARSWRRQSGGISREAAEQELSRLYFRGVRRNLAFLNYTAGDVRSLCQMWAKNERYYESKRAAVEPFADLMEASEIETVADLPDELLIDLRTTMIRRQP